MTEPLNVKYGERTFTYAFEVMHITNNHPVSIGKDLMKPFGIGMTGLIFHWGAREKERNEAEAEIPKPNVSPAGTAGERTQFQKEIQPYMDANQAIPPNSFCTLPEAVVHLPTPPGKTVFRCQYRIAHTQWPIIKETIDKWLANGII